MPNTPSPFPVYTPDNAPSQSVPHLQAAFKAFNMIPNLEGVMAGAPALLESYVTTWALFETTSLSPIERQIVYQVANFENNCEYCVPWHTILSEQAGMEKEDVEALRQGSPLSTTKHEALRVFTRAMIRTRGSIAPTDLQAFLNAGYAEQQVMEVILGLAIKTMSNYTNAIAQTPLDSAAQRRVWQKPTLREGR